MNRRKCVITGKTNDLFALELETDDGEKYTVYVNGSAWEAIGAIANRSQVHFLGQTVSALLDRVADLEAKTEKLETITALMDNTSY